MPFAEASDQTLIASLDLQVPYAQSAGFGDSASSAQIVLYFGLTDTKTFRTMAIGMSIFDSRGTSSLDIGIENGPGGTGALYVVQPAGESSPYDVVVPGAAQFAGAPWTGERHFAFEITPGTLSHLISVVNANAPPGQQFSTNSRGLPAHQCLGRCRARVFRPVEQHRLFHVEFPGCRGDAADRDDAGPDHRREPRDTAAGASPGGRRRRRYPPGRVG